MWIDAHNHLHDARLAAFPLSALEEQGIRAAVVNGTREADWDAVAQLATKHLWVRPAWGLHPWYVRERSPVWREKLGALLEAAPRASIGEIGLDRWIEGADLAAQMDVFRSQLALAAERQLPVTIHCLRAWGALAETLRDVPVPERGFLLHAYGGPREMVEGFVKLGAYFSFSGYFLHPRKAAAREIFRLIPLGRLLVETDAPDMAPPPVPGAQFVGAHNSPANIALNYRALAELRGMPLEELVAAVAENFARLFGAG